MTSESGQDFAQIFHRNYDFVKYYLVKLGAKSEDCDDILEDTFLRYFRLMQRSETMPNHRRFLVVIARNLHSDHCRSNRKVVPGLLQRFMS